MMGDASNRLGIAAVGMPEGAMLGEAFPVSGITRRSGLCPDDGRADGFALERLYR